MGYKIKPLSKTKIYKPKRLVAPLFENNVITDNETLPNGNVINSSAENAALARQWVDENHK